AARQSDRRSADSPQPSAGILCKTPSARKPRPEGIPNICTVCQNDLKVLGFESSGARLVLLHTTKDVRRYSEINRPTFSRLEPRLSQVCRFIPFTELEKQNSRNRSLYTLCKAKIP